MLETLANTVLSRIEDVIYADLKAQEAAMATAKTPTSTSPAENSIQTSGEEPDKLTCAANTPTSRTLLDFMGWGVDPHEAQVK